MVARFLLIALLGIATSAWCGSSRQLCLSCHAVHYPGRGSCSGCHQGNPDSGRKNVAHYGLRHGKYASFTLGDHAEYRQRQGLMNRLACRRCHVSGGRGNKLAANLDGSTVRKTAGELAQSIQLPVESMPDFRLGEEQVTMLVNAILEGGQTLNPKDAAPVRVHFAAVGSENRDVFSKKCGSCHRMLSLKLGSIGFGKVAPNLSGLFSEFYPRSYKNGAAWSARNLEAWLDNPRKVHSGAMMQPVKLDRKEILQILAISSLVYKL